MAEISTVCIYEDSNHSRFSPLTELRPVYALRAGIVPLFERIKRVFPQARLVLVCRQQVAPLLAETYRDVPVNIIKRGEGGVLFVNGRVRNHGDLPDLVRQARLSTRYVHDGETVAVLFEREILKRASAISTQEEFQAVFQGERAVEDATSATLYQHLWDLVEDIDDAIAVDFLHLRESSQSPSVIRVHEGAHLVHKNFIHFGEGVELMPTAVVDASRGPVYLDENVRVEPHAAVVGPCYIGADTVVLAGKVTGSSIGRDCRIGGEVEASVFHAYVNKYHAGFIGHSYVGQWANFGAMTTNSDLKNNYSTIRVMVGGEEIDTGSIKVGSFIGDHTKFGIGTLLTTGAVVGMCCNLFGGNLITDRSVPPFSWGNSDGYEKYQLDKAVDTARQVCARREVTLSDHEESLIRAVFEDRVEDNGVMRF